MLLTTLLKKGILSLEFEEDSEALEENEAGEDEINDDFVDYSTISD